VRLALVPLDDRPVNTALVADVARIAGGTVVLPPSSCLPHFRQPGDTDALATWLVETCDSGVDGVVVSLDMLGYGGLIASRTSHDPAQLILTRLAVLDRIHSSHPELPIGGVNVFLRASNSDNATEEPEYWTDYGRRLHALGGRVHQVWSTATADGQESVPDARIPDEVRQDFARRRLRNHIVNLLGLELVYSRTVGTLLLTADDTAPLSAGSAEQSLVTYWLTLLGHRDDVLVYPGADEVAAVMTARMLSRHHDVTVSFGVTCVESDGLDRVAPFENTPLAVGVSRQIAAAGGRVDATTPDVRLFVHAPSPAGGDFCGDYPEPTDPGLIATTVETIRISLDAGERVAIADCRYPNGGDPSLVEALRDSGILMRLAAYGGWNTAGNALGSTVAAAVAAVVGESAGTLRPLEQQRFLLARLVEDYGYQSRVRRAVATSHQEGRGGPGADPTDPETALWVRDELQQVLNELVGPSTAWQVGSVTFPWGRAFEIGLQLEHGAADRP
jgi:hypothetical protein